jgi:NAD(P)H-quinone oxidoreductase subunit L
MGAGGLEPPQPDGLRILSALRLPIPPCPHAVIVGIPARVHHVGRRPPARPRLAFSAAAAVSLPGPLSSLSIDTLLVLGGYLALAGAYLVVVPLALLWWMTKRWTVMGKIERTAVYGLVFLFFPGLIVFAPFLNLRMAGQGPYPS